LFVWANVPFTVSLCVAVIFALLQVTGVLGLLAGGGEAHAEADADVDVDADADADADHDADSDQDHDASDAGGKGFLEGLGVGKVPISIVWQTFAATFGLGGIAMNTFLLTRTGSVPAYALAWALPAALALAYGVTRAVSGALGRVLSDPKQEATSRAQLVGKAATVISCRVTSEFGEVRVHDKSDQWIYVVCRIRESEPVIAEGTEVVFVEHDRDSDRLYVAPLDLDDDPRVRRRRSAP
jgi:membrane protein implicated in regulation of membrane protease activity